MVRVATGGVVASGDGVAAGDGVGAGGGAAAGGAQPPTTNAIMASSTNAYTDKPDIIHFFIILLSPRASC